MDDIFVLGTNHEPQGQRRGAGVDREHYTKKDEEKEGGSEDK